MPITILIVDDQRSIRKLIRGVLKGFVDAVFLEANDATEALKIARERSEDIDLLISDVVMHGNGRSVVPRPPGDEGVVDVWIRP